MSHNVKVVPACKHFIQDDRSLCPFCEEINRVVSDKHGNFTNGVDGTHLCFHFAKWNGETMMFYEIGGQDADQD